MDNVDYVWVVKYNQVLGDILYVCKTEACASGQAEMIVENNRHRFEEYPEDKPREQDLPYSRMSNEELLGWWFEYTEAVEEISVQKLQVLSDVINCHAH
jgi:hypothetical protein